MRICPSRRNYGKHDHNYKITAMMTRRDFIRTSGLLGAAFAASPLTQSCIFSDSSHYCGVTDYGKTDILVIGGGPAGVCAAIAAARAGAKVLLVESGAFLGGMATAGLVSPFMTCYDSKGERQIIKGLFEEVVQRMVAINGALHPSGIRGGSAYTAWITKGHDHVTPFEGEALKYVFDRMCDEAGVEVLLHSSFVGPVMKGDKIAGAIFLCKEGLKKVEAKIVIDCTGDGDVAASAGVPTEFGDKDSGTVQPATLFFTINNVDSAVLEADVKNHLHEFKRVNGVSYRALHWCVAKAEENNEWDIARKSVNIYKKVKDDEWAVNCSRISNVDSTSSESLSHAEAEGRRQVQTMMNFFHKYVPGCENATLMSTGSTLGIRESRHIIGEHILQAEDLIRGIVPQDNILIASNSVDVHGKGGGNKTSYTTIDADWYGVPYRCLIPLGVENLLVAGRCLSATSDAAGAVRVMPPVMAMGQAAGLAAALAIRTVCTPRILDYSLLRKSLLENGVML